MKISKIGCVGAALLLVASAAFAHHSSAMFERDKQVELVGTIVTFAWTNPHSWIEIDVPNANGGMDRWGVECNSPNNLARQGWKSSTLKPGDQVTILVHPLRSGEKGGRFISVKLANGDVYADSAGAGYAAPPKP
ncbi:MAG: DUF6152 family protein [Candidatus Acidiferrales bacterium]|jgi:uncharacterized protein DUF6152